MKKPSEFNSIEELEDELEIVNKKFKNSAVSMWASLPMIALFTITSIIGFATSFPWVAFGSLGLVGASVLAMCAGMGMSFKYSNLAIDYETEIHKRELAESMKKLSKEKQNSKEFEVKAEQNKTKQIKASKNENDLSI